MSLSIQNTYPREKRTKLTTFDSLMHIYIPYNLAATKGITIYRSKIWVNRLQHGRFSQHCHKFYETYS